MIPLRDENPTSRTAVVTMLLIAACVVVWFFVQQPQREREAEFTYKTAAIPCEVVEGRPLAVEEVRRTIESGDDTACTDAPRTRAVFPDKSVWLAVLYSMFLHGGLLHLGGNMLYLWVFGNNIEDELGPLGYLAFYLAGGLAATVAHIAVQPSSTVPVVGASGALAAVMGAYLVLHPNAQIRSLIIFFFILIRDISAKWLLGIWFVTQFFTNPNEGVAWVAHVGGFLFGVAGGLIMRARRPPVRADLQW